MKEGDILMTEIRSDIAENTTIKEIAVHLIAQLPDQATWDDIMYEIYACQKIDEGLKVAKEFRVLSHEAVKERFGIK